MCFNFEISLGTFIFSWSTSLYLFHTKKLTKDQHHNIIFLMIFSTMQLLDAILWWNKMKKNKLNFIVTSYFIPFVLSSQIIYNIYYKNSINNVYLNIITALFICYIFMRFQGYSRSVCDNYFSSPIWGGKEVTYVELILFLIFSVLPNWNLIIVGLILLWMIMNIFKGGYGSMWCALANIWAIYYLYEYS